jgi:hypothetical protein
MRPPAWAAGAVAYLAAIGPEGRTRRGLPRWLNGIRPTASVQRHPSNGMFKALLAGLKAHH